jgi:hypothetical protein
MNGVGEWVATTHKHTDDPMRHRRDAIALTKMAVRWLKNDTGDNKLSKQMREYLEDHTPPDLVILCGTLATMLALAAEERHRPDDPGDTNPAVTPTEESHQP